MGAPLMSWLLIVALALVTLGMRISFIATLKPHAIPPFVREVLAYVAPAVLAAIVVPPILIRDGVLDVGLDSPRMVAGIAAFAIAWFTRSVVGTVVGGMATLWLVQWLLAP
jgi:branched-subunit amino acid transport protein